MTSRMDGNPRWRLLFLACRLHRQGPWWLVASRFAYSFGFDPKSGTKIICIQMIAVPIWYIKVQICTFNQGLLVKTYSFYDHKLMFVLHPL